MSIYTIGYEGLGMEDFLGLLRRNDVDTLVDIRELPLSRKRGFSKNGLREILEANGFRYCHIAELGCPKLIRNQYREDGDWQRYKKDFRRYLAHCKDVIADLSERAGESRCALMCFEADYQMCHRSMVAEAVKRASGLDVHHLTGQAS